MTIRQPEARSVNPRLAAFKILLRFQKNQIRDAKSSEAFSGNLKTENLLDNVIHQAVADASISDEDRGLLTALTYGVLRYWWAGDAVIGHLSRFPLEKMQAETRVLLKLALFQIQYMDRVPDYAAVNTTVELARKRKLSPKTVSLINGILRNFLRQKEAGALPELKPSDWFPVWFSDQLLAHYGESAVQGLANQWMTPPTLCVRFNTLLNTPELDVVSQAEKAFQQAGYTLMPIIVDGEGCSVLRRLSGQGGSPRQMPGYTDGWFYVQDPSSYEAACWLEVEPGQTVVDLCAAPGSKTTHLAQLMQNQGCIWAVEPSAERQRLLLENSQRLNVSNIKPVLGDGQSFDATLLPEGLADRVLVDVPCTGTGTVHKHPEILLQIQAERSQALHETQRGLLEKGLSLLKTDGILVYSTCSILPDENAEIVHSVLEAVQGEAQYTLLREEQKPITQDADGFYMAKIQRTR